MVSRKRHFTARIGCVIFGILPLAGCAEQEAEIKRLQTANAALEHDVGRYRRESSDCVRELQKTKADLARAQGGTKGNEELIAEMRQAMETLLKEKEGLSRQQDEISQKLLGVEKQLAERMQQNVRATKRVRELEEQVQSLSAEVQALHAGQGTSTTPQNK